MKIAFWSPLHGTGETASLLAIAIALSEMKKQKVLVTHTHYNLNNLEGPLLGKVEDGEFFRDTGLDACMRHFKSGNITQEHIHDCSIRISENLFLMAGTKNSHREGYESRIVKNMIAHIIGVVEQYYDIVLVDTNSGNNEYSMMIMEECDIIVVTLRQDRHLLDDFFENEFFEKKKIFFLFGDYDMESKYSLSNLKRLYRRIEGGNSGEILHNARFKDAICDEAVFKYLTRKKYKIRDEHPDALFFSTLEDTAEKLYVFVKNAISEKGRGG